MYVCVCARARVRACVRTRDIIATSRRHDCVHACVACARIRFSRENVLERKTGGGEGGWNENEGGRGEKEGAGV